MNILLIMPDFHHYSKDIVETLEKRGNKVFLYYLSIKMNFDRRIMGKIYPNYNQKIFDCLIDEIIDKNINNNFDEIVVIHGGRFFTKKHIDKIKNVFPKAKTIYYAWDSVKNYPNILSFYDSFDKYVTFDYNDAKKYNILFLPLFYPSIFFRRNETYDCCSIMTMTNEKICNYIKVRNSLPRDIIYTSQIIFKDFKSLIYNKIVHFKNFKGFSLSEAKYKNLSREEVYQLLANSKVVLDIPLENQSGLTIRVFEALKLGTKIITTNKSIMNYDFYDKSFIFVYNGEKEIPKSFFETSDKVRISDKYSIETFIDQLFYEYKDLKYIKEK